MCLYAEIEIVGDIQVNKSLHLEAVTGLWGAISLDTSFRMCVVLILGRV